MSTTWRQKCQVHAVSLVPCVDCYKAKMAGSLCKPPDPVFDENAAQNWQEFEEKLQWYIDGPECGEKSDVVKIGIMLTHAGKHAREIYKTLQWAEDGDKKKFDKVQKAFRDYCQPRKNVLYERHKFWNLQQDEGKTVDAYITRLRLQADYCDYDKERWPPAVKNEIVRVFGL